MTYDEEHTLTAEEARVALRDAKLSSRKTDRVVARSRGVTEQLRQVNDNPDHVIEHLRSIIAQGGAPA